MVVEALRRVALVTGANRGMGLETCRELLGRGLRVALTGRDEQTIQRALRGLSSSSEDAIAVPLDVTDRDSIQSARRVIVDRWGAVDVIVNNAAVLPFENEEVLSIPDEGFEDALDTNLLGVIRVCRAFVPAMAEQGYGRVVNVSSGAGQLTKMDTYAPAYSVSKAALNKFTRMLAAAHRNRGVLVNAVDPGWVRTDMGGPSAPRSLEQGVDTTVWLATLPEDGPTGGFFRDRRPIEW